MSTAPAPLPPPNGLVRLADWGVIRASGEDARKFLHGQLTQDIERHGDGQARLAGYCTAKGRLLATFVVWARSPDEVLLACSADLLNPVLKRLSMFVLRARCKLSDASADRAVWGLAGEAAVRALGPAVPAAAWQRSARDAADLIRLPDARMGSGAAVPRFLWVGDEPPALPALGQDAWHWLEARSGVARVVAATSEQFVPQMVNLELVGGVNFQKGCYPGQEIVARSQYRGTLKRRGQVVDSAVALAPGQEIFHDADPGQPAGMVVLAGTWAGSHAALVELKLSALDGGSLHAGAADGALLTPAALPYDIPAETA
jgi:folate-binding protein YgfZ